MERDPKISKLIREGGVVPAPEGFAGKVMDLITDKPERKAYKPLIGKWGIFLAVFLLAAIVTLSIIFATPAEGNLELARFFGEREWQWPQIKFNFDFFSNLSYTPGAVPTWVVSTLVAIFILVLLDTRVLKRGLF